MSGRPRNEKHLETLAEIREFMKERGYSPTLRDLMTRTGIASTSTVSYHLNKLETMGLIRRDANVCRGIVVCGTERQAAQKASYESIAKKKAEGARAALDARAKKIENATSGYYTSAVAKMPKGKSLEDRIEMVAQLAEKKEREGKEVNAKYALHNARGLFNSGRVCGSKVS